MTRDAAEADVLVVNTRAFIDKAKQESIDAILECDPADIAPGTFIEADTSRVAPTIS